MDGHGRLAYSTLALTSALTSALTVTPLFPPPSIKKLQGKLEFLLQAAIYCLFVLFFLINKTNNALDKSSRWKRLWKIKTIPTLEFLILPRNSLLNLSLNPDPLFSPFTSKKLARRGSWNSWCSLCLWPRRLMPACCCPVWPRVTLHHASAGCLETSCWKRGTCRAALWSIVWCIYLFWSKKQRLLNKKEKTTGLDYHLKVASNWR